MKRILIAHSSKLVCDSLRTAFAAEDVYIVGCATSSEEIHFLAPHCNIVLLETTLGNENSLDILADLRAKHPAIKTLVLGLEESPEAIINYIEAGASGYILHSESVAEMLQKVQAAYEEKAIISPAMAAAIFNRLSHLANLDMPVSYLESREAQLAELTRREVEVLKLITKGLTNQEIAADLLIECGTVKNHVHNILTKLEVSNRHDAAVVFKNYSFSSGKSAPELRVRSMALG